MSIFFASFAIIALTVFLVIINFSQLPPLVPLFYSKPWGEEQLVPKAILFAIPLITFIFLLINLTLVRIVSGSFLLQKGLPSYILSWLSALAALLGVITVVKILLVV